MKSQILFTFEGGVDSPTLVTYQSTPPANEGHRIAMDNLARCFAEDFPNRCREYSPVAKTKDASDSHEVAKLRQSVKALFKIGNAPSTKAYNNALLDVMNILSKP